MHQGKTLWVALVAVAAAALFTLGTQSAPLTPDAVEALLPKFCSYKVDVSALKSPYVAFDKATGHETVTCPFVAGVTKEAMSYAPRGNAPCTSRDLPGLTIVSAMEISGRNARTAERCALGHRPRPRHYPTNSGGNGILFATSKRVAVCSHWHQQCGYTIWRPGLAHRLRASTSLPSDTVLIFRKCKIPPALF